MNLSDLWEEKADYPSKKIISRSPCSEILYMAECMGTCEAFEDKEVWVDYTLAGGVNRVSFYPSEHPLEVRDLAARTRYAFKAGEIEYGRCRRCGVPEEMSR